MRPSLMARCSAEPPSLFVERAFDGDALGALVRRRRSGERPALQVAALAVGGSGRTAHGLPDVAHTQQNQRLGGCDLKLVESAGGNQDALVAAELAWRLVRLIEARPALQHDERVVLLAVGMEFVFAAFGVALDRDV